MSCTYSYWLDWVKVTTTLKKISYIWWGNATAQVCPLAYHHNTTWNKHLYAPDYTFIRPLDSVIYELFWYLISRFFLHPYFSALVVQSRSSQYLTHLYLYQGAPIVVSFPHFYQADPKYINGVEGLNPNKEEHETYLDLQPVWIIFVTEVCWEICWTLLSLWLYIMMFWSAYLIKQKVFHKLFHFNDLLN